MEKNLFEMSDVQINAALEMVEQRVIFTGEDYEVALEHVIEYILQLLEEQTVE